jgi:hypothetical protein
MFAAPRQTCEQLPVWHVNDAECVDLTNRPAPADIVNYFWFNVLAGPGRFRIGEDPPVIVRSMCGSVAPKSPGYGRAADGSG